MEAEGTVKVNNRFGLHARASATLAALAQKYRSNVWISRSDARDQEVDGKSILGILTLGAERGMSIKIKVSGDDADEALKAIAELFRKNFDEE